MAEKRSAPIDDTPAKEAKVDPYMINESMLDMYKQMYVACDIPVLLDRSFVKYSRLLSIIYRKYTYSDIPGDNIPSQTWIFINNFIINRGFEGNPPTEYSLAQLFHVLERYKINVQDIFLPKQYTSWRDELLICIKNDMFKFNDVFNGNNLNMYFEFITELFRSNLITVIRQTPSGTCIDGQKIHKFVENLVHCPRLQLSVSLSTISKFYSQGGYSNGFDLKD